MLNGSIAGNGLREPVPRHGLRAAAGRECCHCFFTTHGDETRDGGPGRGRPAPYSVFHDMTITVRSRMSSPFLLAVIVQYGNWRDTALCVESLLAGDVVPDRVVIVDNASRDGSAGSFLSWLRGGAGVAAPEFFSGMPVSKPVAFTELAEQDLGEAPMPPTRCVYIRLSRNGGYAAGNNVGLRLGLRWGADAFLILNNDTLVSREAVGALRDRLFACERPGLCGGLLRYRHEEQLVQCLAGGRTDPRTALSHIMGQGLTLEEARRVPRAHVEAAINYICGACVMASREFVESVGLLDEGYFLYCEEQDWACRAAGKFDLAYAPGALVWHREGVSTGWNGRGPLALRPLLRLTASRLRCTWLHHRRWLPTVLAGIAYAAARLCVKKLWRRLPGSRGRSAGERGHA